MTEQDLREINELNRRNRNLLIANDDDHVVRKSIFNKIREFMEEASRIGFYNVEAESFIISLYVNERGMFEIVSCQQKKIY